MSFSPDRRRLAIVSGSFGRSGTVTPCDTATGEPLVTLSEGMKLWREPVGVTADRNALFALNGLFGRTENRLHVWDATPLPEPGN